MIILFEKNALYTKNEYFSSMYKSYGLNKIHFKTSLKDFSKTYGLKTELFILRTDGKSCTREIVNESGSLYFECTSTNQHLLLWKTRPKWYIK